MGLLLDHSKESFPMFEHEKLAKNWLRSNVRANIPANAKTYRFTTLTNRSCTSSMGFKIDHSDFTGTVIESNPDFMVVKSGRTEFVIIDPKVLREELHEGSKVSITPYARRHFDGRRLTDPAPVTAPSGLRLSVTIIGASVSDIPVVKPTSKLGLHLLDNLQRMRCPDGIRVLSNLLVDVGAENFRFVDVDLDNTESDVDLQFIFDCSNLKFSGRVTIGVDRGLGLFYIDMHKVSDDQPDVLQHRCEGVCLDSLAEVLSTLLCDGEWRFAKVEVLHRAKAKQLVSVSP